MSFVSSRSAGVGVVGLVLVGLIAAFGLLRPALPPAVPVELAEARAQGACVAPPEEIRRSHPDLLRHQRDLTVREGQRGARVSLEACVACHATAAPGAAVLPVNSQRSVLGSPQAFCQGCHAQAAVKIDCFECHAASPAAAAAGRAAVPTTPVTPATPAASASLSRVVAALRTAPVSPTSVQALEVAR